MLICVFPVYVNLVLPLGGKTLRPLEQVCENIDRYKNVFVVFVCHNYVCPIFPFLVFQK